MTVHGGYAMKFLDSLVKTEGDIPVIRTMNSVFTNLPQALAGIRDEIRQHTGRPEHRQPRRGTGEALAASVGEWQ